MKFKNHLVLSRLAVLAAVTIGLAHLGSWISLHPRPSLWNAWDLLSLAIRVGVCVAFPIWSFGRLRALRARAHVEGPEASYPLGWRASNIAWGVGAASVLAASLWVMVFQYLKS